MTEEQLFLSKMHRCRLQVGEMFKSDSIPKQAKAIRFTKECEFYCFVYSESETTKLNTFSPDSFINIAVNMEATQPCLSTANKPLPRCRRPENFASSESEKICVGCEAKVVSTADVLIGMAKTFTERNAMYKDNNVMVPKIIEILFPEGVSKELLFDIRWHNFELIIVKLTRFAISKLEHQDSIHDIGVYSAMLESFIINNKGENNE